MQGAGGFLERSSILIRDSMRNRRVTQQMPLIISLVGHAGVEPATLGLRVPCSTN